VSALVPRSNSSRRSSGRSAASGPAKRATSVTSLENLALLDIECRRLSHQVQLSGRVLSALDRAGITASMATQSAHGQAVAVVVPMVKVDKSASFRGSTAFAMWAEYCAAREEGGSMALVRCPECQRSVAEKARKCSWPLQPSQYAQFPVIPMYPP